MKISCGIIGLPNVGKSTLFKTLTDVSVKISNFPFCTIQPNIATVQIPDCRLYQLNNIINARSIVHGIVEFIDVAGLIKGASQGAGLGNKILQCIKMSSILCHVVRCFDNNTIIHVEHNIDPYRDINIVNTEFILFDILQCEKKINFLQKNYKIVTTQNIDQQLAILKKCLIYLYRGELLRKIKFSNIEKKSIKNFNFLTFKPVIYIANTDQKKENNIYYSKLQHILKDCKNIPIICYWPDYSVENYSRYINDRYVINLIIHQILFLLKLNTFFTVNKNMIRAWINVSDTTALDASNNVHSDFKKGFIRAQVIKFEDFIKNKGESGSKKSGKLRYEGKKYQIEDGDVLKFLFHI